ncbi:MAG: hypothetical protein AAB600_02095 [Patescibacteria group bacterium]
MELLYAFLAGLFLANGVPHFVKGITGQTHMTPFKRVSSASLNVIWGFVNFLIGFFFMNLSGESFRAIASLDSFSWSFMFGVVFMALSDAWLFSKPNARLPWQKD